MGTGASLTHLIILAPAALHRAAWRALLCGQPGIAIAGTAAEVDELPSLLRPTHPTTILIDVPVPHPALARCIQAAAADRGLLFLVSSYQLEAIVALLQAGATGCVSRDDSVGDLARAVIAAGRGEIVLPPSIAARALALLARGSHAGDNPAEALSEREQEVLRLLARGLTNKDIAQTLILSVRTIEGHLRSIFAKLGLGSRTEAALWAIRHGFGPDE